MVNKCAVFGCKRGYESEEPQHEDYHVFYFPLDERKSHLLHAFHPIKWMKSMHSFLRTLLVTFLSLTLLMHHQGFNAPKVTILFFFFDLTYVDGFPVIFGGRFLVSLREMTNSERIIRCHSLVKADINFWKEDLGSDKPSLDFSALLALLSEHEIEILNRLLIRVAKKFPLLLRVTSPKNWQKGLIATVVNCYLLQVQWTWQKTIT